MRKIIYTTIFLLLIAACTPKETDAELVADLLEQAGQDVGNQRFDAALEKGLRALEISRKEGDRLGEVRALASIVGTDIMASRDADAWEKALMAEAICREEGYKQELAGILISKAKLCSYAEVSPETGRNDEGLEYASEALSLAQETDDVQRQCEACYVIGSLYINKNRWSDPIDQDIYRTAGEYLDKGQALAETYDFQRLRRNGILFRSRWFQQGGRNEEAIEWFTQVKAGLKDSDHLTAASLDDRLVRLYTRTGQSQQALDAHDDYVFHMQKYMSLKADETLQEMETRFEVHEKELRLKESRYQIILLIIVLLLAAAVIVLVTGHLRKTRRRNAELQRINDSKEQIIELLAKDLKNPANAMADEIAGLSASAATLTPEKIRQKCQELAKGAESINTDVARYVGDILVERSRKIADIGLSKREIQIIRLSAEGLTASQIAEKTFLSVHTVNTHRQRIYAKMDVKNISDMIRKSRELGII
ncbi:MAG: response regulator transcription factor [Bacteroidales bacterium]|nr:response regulator transcription factor [Bacteroidales bacterium]